MYIDKFEILSVGTKWIGNKKKKNQILTRHYSDEGIILKKILPLVDAFDDAHHPHARDVTITVTFKEND